MKATDLMIGDWVICNDLKRQVAAIGETVGFLDCNNQVYWAYEGFDRIDPIPLTEEILVKNGYEKNHNDEAPAEECYFYRLFAKPCGWFDIDAFGLEEELGAEFTYHDININYVHQLQHLLRLVGVQKEIEL